MSNIRKNKSKLHAKSRLSSYGKNGKKLTPPMLKINESGGGVVFSSWINDRLPDILWCVLLRMQCPNDWKEIIMKILGQLSELDIDDKKKAITHTGISAMPEKLKEEFIKKIVASCGNENQVESNWNNLVDDFYRVRGIITVLYPTNYIPGISRTNTYNQER